MEEACHIEKEGVWNLIGNSSDENVEDGGFVILGEMIIGMIAKTEQVKGVEVILAEVTNIQTMTKRCPGTFRPQESLRQRIRMRIQAVR